MSQGKPQLSSFFSSSVAATGAPPVAPGADTPPAAPAVQPPVTTARPDRSCPKLPGGPRTYQEESVLQPLHGVTDKACLNAPQDPSAYPTPDHGSCGTPEPVPVKPPRAIREFPPHPEVPIHEVLDPPRRMGSAVTNGLQSTPEPAPLHVVPVKPRRGISEDAKHQVRDPPRRPKAVTDQPAQCSPAAPAV